MADLQFSVGPCKISRSVAQTASYGASCDLSLIVGLVMVEVACDRRHVACGE